MMGVGARAVYQVAAIAKASPEKIEEIREGKTSVDAAHKEIKKAKQEGSVGNERLVKKIAGKMAVTANPQEAPTVNLESAKEAAKMMGVGAIF